MIEGDPFLAAKSKISIKKKDMSLTDYYMDIDRKESFTARKFT